MKTLTQKDLCILFLSHYGGWIESYKMNGRPFDSYFLGAQSDKRMIEIMDGVADAPTKTVEYKISGDTYQVETKKDRGIRMYRAFLSSKKPVQKVEMLINGSVRISYVQEKVEEPITIPSTW